jgi:hypothetical protein
MCIRDSFTWLSAGPPPGTTTDPAAMQRLSKLMRLYQYYTAEKRKPPANEQEFRAFLSQLPDERKAAYLLTEDVDVLLTSPQDGQKFVVRYGVAVNATGEPQAFAWEATGQGGKRFVARTDGYVVECTEEDFRGLKKK